MTDKADKTYIDRCAKAKSVRKARIEAGDIRSNVDLDYYAELDAAARDRAVAKGWRKS